MIICQLQCMQECSTAHQRFYINILQINIILKMLDALEIGSILPLDMMVYDIIFASKKVEFLCGLDDICVVFSKMIFVC